MTKEKAERITGIYNWVRFIILMLFLTFVFAGLENAQTNDFGIWTNVGAEKGIGKRWSVTVSTELRTKEKSGSIDRWQLATSGTYKMGRALKLGVGYEFHQKNQSTERIKEMMTRHRLMFDVIPDCKIVSWLKWSLRERYQFTYMMPKNGIAASKEHHLRSRLKMEMTKNSWKWSPYVSFETFNKLGEGFNIDEIRMVVGTTYRFNSHHALSFGYLVDLKGADNKLDNAIQVITSGYLYQF